MRRAAFRRLVSRALEDLPSDILEKMDNVEVLVEARPSDEQDTAAGEGSGEGLLMGLYEGTPLTERSSAYGGALPDRITLFQRNIEAVCETTEEMVEEIRRTVLHEIAHHFGIGDDRLHDLGY